MVISLFGDLAWSKVIFPLLNMLPYYPLVARQQKFLRAKIGGVEDEMHEEEEEDEEEKKTVWGRRKSDYYSADNVDYEVSIPILNAMGLLTFLYFHPCNASKITYWLCCINKLMFQL